MRFGLRLGVREMEGRRWGVNGIAETLQAHGQ